MNKKLIKSIPLLTLLPLCASAVTYTADPGPGTVDIAGGAVLDASGGAFNSTAVFTGTGDMTVQGGTVRFLAAAGSSTFTGDVNLNSQTDFDAGGVFGNSSNVVNINTSVFRSRLGATLDNDLVVLQNTQLDNATSNTTLTLNGNISTDFQVNLGSGFGGDLNRNVTLAGDISGSGSLINYAITDDRVYNLNGFNTYSGITTVRNGTWNVNGTHSAQSNYTVFADTTLGGTGTIALSNGAQLNITGILDLATLKIDLGTAGDTVVGSQIINLSTGGGSVSNAPTDINDILINSDGYSIALNGFGNYVVTAIPEPSTYALFSGLLVLGAMLTRRRIG